MIKSKSLPNKTYSVVLTFHGLRSSGSPTAFRINLVSSRAFSVASVHLLVKAERLFTSMPTVGYKHHDFRVQMRSFCETIGGSFVRMNPVLI